MKSIFSAVIILIMLTLTSCTSSNVGVQYSFLEPNAEIHSDIGFLKVYTYKYEEKGTAWDDPVYEVFKGYTIYTRDGDFVMHVYKSYDEPKMVKLNGGEFIVIAELHKNIIHSFPVEIERGKILEIDAGMINNPFASK